MTADVKRRVMSARGVETRDVEGSVNEIVIFPGDIGLWVARAGRFRAVGAATPNALGCPCSSARRSGPRARLLPAQTPTSFHPLEFPAQMLHAPPLHPLLKHPPPRRAVVGYAPLPQQRLSIGAWPYQTIDMVEISVVGPRQRWERKDDESWT